MGGIVYVHTFLAALLAEGVDHGGYLRGAEKGAGAESAGSEAFFYADDLAAV